MCFVPHGMDEFQIPDKKQRIVKTKFRHPQHSTTSGKAQKNFINTKNIRKNLCPSLSLMTQEEMTNSTR